MDSIREYAISIIAATLICSSITAILQHSAAKEFAKLLGGLIIALTVAAPLRNVVFSFPENLQSTFSDAAEIAVQEGESLSHEALRQVIKEKTEAYILDKAATLGSDLSVQVTLSKDDPPIPYSAIIEGELSPSGKRQLQYILQTQLGIPKENLEWTG